jgi:hypothetical protein
MRLLMDHPAADINPIGKNQRPDDGRDFRQATCQRRLTLRDLRNNAFSVPFPGAREELESGGE